MPNIDGLVWLGYLTHFSEDTIKPIFENNFFGPKGGSGRFSGSMRRRGFHVILIFLTYIYIWHFLDDISAPRTRIISSIASLKPCYKAGRFEYNKAYI